MLIYSPEIEFYIQQVLILSHFFWLLAAVSNVVYHHIKSLWISINKNPFLLCLVNSMPPWKHGFKGTTLHTCQSWFSNCKLVFSWNIKLDNVGNRLNLLNSLFFFLPIELLSLMLFFFFFNQLYLAFVII